MRTPSCSQHETQALGWAQRAVKPPPSPCWVLLTLLSLYFGQMLSPHTFLHLCTHLVQVDGMKTHLSRSKLW